MIRRVGARAVRGMLGAAVLLTMLTPAALARGGSGSFHFGGGGGGGRGFSGLGRGFGHGRFFFIPIGGGGGVILAIIVIAVIVYFVLPQVMKWWRGQASRGRTSSHKVSDRALRVQRAAAEAAEEDPAFAPDEVKPAAAKLFTDIQRAWDAGDRVRLRGLVAPGLMAEWERRLDDIDRRGWRNRVEVIDQPKVDYVGLHNAGDDSGDRVVVRIRARLRDYMQDGYGQRVRRTDSLTDTSSVHEYWTLGKRENHWVLVSIEQGAEGAHALTDEIVASPWADDRALRDEALTEAAVAEALPEGTSVAEVADLDFRGDARAAANDLSLADGRFAPDILEVAARRAVAAWAEAVDGPDDALTAIAHPDAADALLYPGDPSHQARVVVRGLKVRQITIAGLDAGAQPPTMTLELALNGRRYVENRNTAQILHGSQNHASDFTERWTLALDGNERQPWRIASVQSAQATR